MLSLPLIPRAEVESLRATLNSHGAQQTNRKIALRMLCQLREPP
jgi:hypothetical protein